MALFSEYDRESATLLTQFVQIELPEGWEESPDKLIGSEVDKLDQWWRGERFGANDSRPLSEEFLALRIADLQTVASLHHWCVEMLEGIASNMVSVRSLKAFQQAYEDIVQRPQITAYLSNIRYLQAPLREHIVRESIMWAGDSNTLIAPRPFALEALDPDASIPLEYIHWFDERNMGLIAHEILNQVDLCLTRREKVRRCADCENPFVVRTEKQTFCSKRCASRVRQRRLRNEQKLVGTL